ncbi:MAG: hypothetical protein ACT4P1_12520 [Sporichthyaceae bacterium]
MSSPGPVARDRTALALSVLFWLPVSCAAVLVALWPPHTVDGPAHVLGALAFVEVGADPSGVYAAYYERDLFPTPNLAGTVLLAELVRFTSLRVAEAIVLVLAAVGIPLALRFAIRPVRPESQWLAIVGLPLSFGYLYFYGFYNYCLAIVLALVCIGVMLRAAPAWRRLPTIGLAALLTVTWLTHLVPFVAAVVFLLALVVTGPRTPRTWVAAGLVVLPGAALSLAYLARTESGDSPSWSGWAGRLPGLLSLHTPVTTFSRWEDAIALAIALVLVALAVAARRGTPARRSAAGVAAVAMIVLLVVAPTRFGLDFGLIDERLAIFPVLFAVLWLAAAPLPARRALAAALALVVATGALLALRVPELRRYDRLAEEYASVERWIEPGSTLVALRFARFGPDAGRNAAWDPTRHLASGLAASTRSIDVGHYEAVLDYFPARFRDDGALRRALDSDLVGFDAVPPDVQSAELASALAPIECVLLVGGSRAVGSAAVAFAQYRLALTTAYVHLGATTPTRLVDVWCRTYPGPLATPD